jgi:hypothetical protein
MERREGVFDVSPHRRLKHMRRLLATSADASCGRGETPAHPTRGSQE